MHVWNVFPITGPLLFILTNFAFAEVFGPEPHLSLRHPTATSAHWNLVLVGGPPLGEAVLYLEPDSKSPVRFPFDPAARQRIVSMHRLNVDGSLSLSLPDGVPDAKRLQDLRVWTGATSSALSRNVGLPPVRRVLVTEFMKDPTEVGDALGEWIELFNPSPYTVDIEGWVLSDLGSNSVPLLNAGQGLPIGPYSFFVLGREGNPALNGGVNVDFDYGAYSLSNGEDEIVLSTAAGELVDQLAYDDGVHWPDRPGSSIQLQIPFTNAYDNDDPAHWCHSDAPFAFTDTGNPGWTSGPCAP